MFEFSCPDCQISIISHKIISKCAKCNHFMNVNELEEIVKVNSKKTYLKEETINYLKKHLEIYENYNSFSVQQRREYSLLLSKQIQVYYENKELEKRNALVDINRNMLLDLPFNFDINSKVLVKIREKKVIKGIVQELDFKTRQVLIKPIDSLYKESFYCNENWIQSTNKPVEIEQMRLF